MWREHPWLGVGPDNFRRVYGGYLRRPDPDTRLHANNFYIETLATLGAAGLVALAGVMVALAGAVRRAGRDPRAGVMALGIGGGMAAYAVHGTLDYFLEFTPTYGLLWLLAGMIVALAGQSPEAGPAAGAPADAGRDDIGGEALGSGRP
jgi:O-antigen ligase